MILSSLSRRFLVVMAVLIAAPLVRADDRIIINVRVNGHPLRFAFDTGAGAPYILLRNVAEGLGIRSLPSPAGIKPGPGEVVMTLTEPTKFEMLGLTFDNAQASVIAMPSYLPVDIQGFVGWPALRTSIVALSMSTNTIEIVDRVPSESEGWIRLRVRPDRDTLCVEIPSTNGGPEGTVLIDTGDSDGVHLSSAWWTQWKAAHARRPVTLDASYTPGAGLVVSEISWAHSLSLGGIVLHEVAVLQSNSAEAGSAGKQYEATLGLAALRRLDLVLDGKAGFIYAHSRTDPPLPYKHNRLGAVFVPQNAQGTDLIAHVVPGSPAADAGIQDGDVLLKIDQLDVSGWRTHPGILPLSRFFEQPAGTSIVFTVKRGGSPVQVPVTLKDILGPAASG